MAELKYDPVAHDQKAFLEKASKRRGFRKAYDALEPEYALAHEMLSVRFTHRASVIRIIGAGYWRKGKVIYERENKIHR